MVKNYLKFKGMLSLFLALVFSVAFAQGQTISGQVTDADDGSGIPGVNIVEKGTSNGTITDIDGNYSLSVSAGATLVFSYVGYVSQEVVVGSQSTINVSLLPDVTQLSEVVVIGYGAVKKSDLTGAVANIGEEDFNKGAFVSPDQLIQGKAAGIQVTQASGSPGAERTIRIRGASSARSGDQPLIVVDGIPLDGRSAKPGVDGVPGGQGNTPGSNPLNFLNPADIESMDVLKDASATAIYGSRGANGVIIITTKKGKSGAPRVELDASIGTSSISNTPDILSAEQYRDALATEGLTGGDLGGNADAMDEISQTGFIQNYNIGVSGGTENSNYRFSFGYFGQDGVIKESSLDKYNATLNSSFKVLKDRVTIDFNLIANHTDELQAPVSNNAGFQGSLIGQALQWNPTADLITGTTGTNADFNQVDGENPLALLAGHNDESKVTTIISSISPTVKITEDLTYKFIYGITHSVGERRYHLLPFLDDPELLDVGFAQRGQNQLTTQQVTHTLNYTKQFGKLNVNALVGYEWQDYVNKTLTVIGRNFRGSSFPNDLTDWFQAVDFEGSARSREINANNDPTNRLRSYFARAILNWDEKFLLTASVRDDASSKLGANNESEIFPSFAGAWNVDEMAFFPQGTILNSLKVRAGWGQAGNVNGLNPGENVERWNYDNLNNYDLRQINSANPNLVWEIISTTNVGIDFGLWDGRLTGTIDWFKAETENLLFITPPIRPAPPTDLVVNLPGIIENSGVEISLDGLIIENDSWSWSLGMNMSFLSNEVTGVPIAVETGDINGQGLTGNRAQRILSGQPLNVFLIRDWTGEFDSNGFALYRTADGGSSTATTDLFFVGDPNPDLLLGIYSTLTYNNFDLTLNMNGAFGHQIYNNTANAILTKGNLGSRNTSPSVVGTEEAVANPPAVSTRYLEDGDFLRLANLTIGYDIPMNSEWVQSAKVFVTGQNLFVLTDYTGFDPEVNTDKGVNDVASFGIEYTPYPPTRNFLLGFKIIF